MMNSSAVKFYRTIVAIFIGVLASVFLYWHLTAESAPRLANYYLRWEIRPGDVAELAKWDLLVLDMETQVTSRAAIEKIRQLNPHIKILVYVTSQEIRHDAASGYSVMRRKISAGIPGEWYLTDANGERYTYWSGTVMLNATNQCPRVNGKNWNEYLADFMAREILSTGLWDGIFYDNTWGGLTWFTGQDVDVNKDGLADGGSADTAWRAGMRELFNTTRRVAGNKYILVGNTVTKEYGEDLNGIMMENFAKHAWYEIMGVYLSKTQHNLQPRIIIINSNTNNSANHTNYRAVRYGLASTLLGDGYFSFDYGDKDHGQVWWYDEYDVNLGEPTLEAQSTSGLPKYTEGIWRRNYANGLVLVNSTGAEQTVDLGAEYEKIIGRQDVVVNNGEITDRVKLGAKDGLLMLKTTQKISNIVFENGALLRFLDKQGYRVRNGFFAFAEDYSSAAQVFSGDLNDEAGEEKIAVAQGKMEIFNSRGERWYNDYPFGVEYLDDLRVAVGKLGASAEASIAVADVWGGVNLYNYYGGLEKQYFYPWGKRRNGQFSLALGNVDADGNVILGGGGGGKVGVVMIYNRDLSKLRRTFFPYGISYRGGVEVAVGDVNGDGQEEIITIQSGQNVAMVRVWSAKAKKLSQFKVTSSFGGTKIRLSAADVNFDGRDEIVVMSK